MKKYEAVIILNPNLSSKADDFIKDFKKLLEANTFNIVKQEDVGRRQLSYSINNHNKGHYLLFNIEGDPSKLIEIENKIKYNESIIRHLFISVKIHSGEDSQLLLDSKNKKNEPEEVVEKLEKVKQPEENKNEKPQPEEDLQSEVSDTKDEDNSEEKDDKDE
ncbi:MAG: 30S ribosomal protein S6 [SAR86 cluster bacterium]|uniref:Small ribosomal subunit protein bS6 n=1 Tax=SAR86 cluster bacterium TaxID=2030880 RepID=A0A520N5H5_9GAMM|nr:MAG: 30S ribosomal protein S6 [SAR86 cluster bacterium]|tara:strand:+ start:1698 stop:2183 length:486 start_codon:yes stop_codon:yes gene_type:complete